MKTLLEKILGLAPLFKNSNPGPAVTSTPISQDVYEVVPSAAVAGDGQYVGKSPASLIGFWGAVPAAQPGSPAGNVHTVTAGSTTAVYVNTSFDGGVGSSAYTIGDIVAALKAAGLIAS
jgi:hypothetical protein